MNDGDRARKNRFISAVMFIGLGLILALIGAYCHFTGSGLYSRFVDFATTFILVGIIDLCVCFYWSRPKHREKYDKRVRDENILAKDERTQAIYGRMGHIMYILTILVLMVFLSVLTVIEIEKPEIDIPYLAILVFLFFFVLIGGWALHRYFDKKL